MEPVRRVRTVDVVSQRLLSAIARGQFKPGTKLPPERELAGMLQVSRNVLREAVRQLETMGVISVRQGDGTYVTEDADGHAIKSPLEQLALADTNVLDLMEARQAIEVKAASLAAHRGGVEDHETLRHILDEMAERLHAPSDYAEKDFQFHYTVVRASRNMVLVKLFTAVQDVLKLYLVRALAVPGVPEISHDRHQRIAEAILSRDPEQSAAEMEGHLLDVTHRLLMGIARQSGMDWG